MKSPHTLRSYQHDRAVFGLFMGLPADHAVAHLLSMDYDVASAKGVSFREWMIASGYSAASTNRAVAAIKTAWRDARGTTLTVRGLRLPPAKPAPDPVDVKRIIRTLDLEDWSDARLAAIIVLVGTQNFRAQQLCDLTLADVSRLALSADARLIIKAYLRHRGVEPGPFIESRSRRRSATGHINPTSVVRLLREAGKRFDVRLWTDGIRFTRQARDVKHRMRDVAALGRLA